MNNYYRVFLGVIVPVFLMSCTASWQPQCRHQALYTAAVLQEDYRVQIVTGLTPRGQRHAQAQACISGRWEWLSLVNDSITITEPEYELSDTRIYTFSEFASILDQRTRHARSGERVYSIVQNDVSR